MSMSYIEPRRFAGNTTGRDHVTVGRNVTAATPHSEAPRGRMPAAIPSDQAYYWTTEWQENEAEALAELDRGESHTFASASDAIRWLLSDDD